MIANETTLHQGLNDQNLSTFIRISEMCICN